MAFFVTTPAKRNLAAEGLLQGMLQGQEMAARQREMKQQMEMQKLQNSEYSSILGDYLKSQGPDANQQDVLKGVLGLPVPQQMKESAIDVLMRTNNQVQNNMRFDQALEDSIYKSYGAGSSKARDNVTPELQDEINYANAFVRSALAQKQDPQKSLLFFQNQWANNPDFQSQMRSIFGGQSPNSEEISQDPSLVDQQIQAPRDPLSQTPDFNPEAQTKRSKSPFEIQKEKERLKIDSGYRQETAAYQGELSKGEQGARESIAKLETLKKLNTGKISSPFIQKFRQETGMDFGAFQTADEQQMESLINQFFAGAGGLKDLMGAGQLSDRDVMTFKKTLPSLLQSKEGRDRAIDMMIDMRKVSIKRNEIANQILDEAKENGEPHPYDLQRQVDRRMPKVYEELTQNLLKSAGIKKEKVKPGTKVDMATARRYLEEAGGDKEKARQFAKEDGYEF